MTRNLITCLLLGSVLGGCDDSVAPGSVPKSPQNLLLSLRLTEIQISWQDVSSDEQVFRVEVSVDDGPFLLLVEAPKNTNIVKYADPQPIRRYKFRVAACNLSGCSEFTEAQVSTDSWARPSVVLSRVQLISPGAVSVSVYVPPGDAPVQLQLLVREDGGIGGDFEVRSEELRGPITKSYYFYGLEPEAIYTAQALVQNPFGTAQSEIRRFTTRDLIPPSLADLHVTDVTATSATVHFRLHPGGAITTYRVTIHAPDYGLMTTAPATVSPDPAFPRLADRPLTSVRFTELRPSNTYTWSVSSTSINGGAPTQVGYFTTPAQ